MTRSSAQLAVLLEQLRNREFTGNTYALLHEFGEADFREAEYDIASYLSNPDAELRSIALSVLVLHWQRQEYRKSAERMLGDSEPDVRRMATAAIGVLTKNSREPRALALLLQLIDDPAEEWHVRDTAYDAILKILGEKPPGYSRLGEPMRWPDDVNPAVLAKARALASNTES